MKCLKDHERERERNRERERERERESEREREERAYTLHLFSQVIRLPNNPS